MNESNRNYPPRRRRRRRIDGMKVTIAFLGLVMVVLLIIALMLPKIMSAMDKDPALQDPQPTGNHSTDSTPPAVEDPTDPTPPPTEPPIEKIATATIGATGDVLLHTRVIKGGLDSATGEYNYDNIFTYFSEYVERVDYGVANMEGTLCGSDNGYKYSGYPCFNAPDAIIDAAKKAGFEMLLTANNHAYDTGSVGFKRTQQVIAEREFDYIGTRAEESDANYQVVDVNGIKIGMTCYTYNTGINSKGNATLNGIGLKAEDPKLINTFDYNDLDGFYEQLSGEMDAMREEGAESIVLYIHWGDEYKLSPNKYQSNMAQELCNLGVDVIVGGHPHVVQPVEMITSETDPAHSTLCLYSMGNAVSNIRRGDGYGIHTEDGMLFTFTFAKYSDGTVVVESTDILPTWVNRYTSSETGREVFAILPLDKDVEDWKTAFDLSNNTLKEAEDSYERTQKIVGEGLESANTFLQEQQAELEEELGVE